MPKSQSLMLLWSSSCRENMTLAPNHNDSVALINKTQEDSIGFNPKGFDSAQLVIWDLKKERIIGVTVAQLVEHPPFNRMVGSSILSSYPFLIFFEHP